ncbi:MAG: PH domain-containing protein [Acidimicrobiales bacterium]
MPSPPIVLPLTRSETLLRALWAAGYGFATGIFLGLAVSIAAGGSPEGYALLRLVGPLGMLAGAVLFKVRAPAMGVIIDDDGVELHGFIRTRRVPWARIAGLGWSKPGRRFAVRLVNGATRSGETRLPRRVPVELQRIASVHDVPILTDRNLRAAAHPLVDVQ